MWYGSSLGSRAGPVARQAGRGDTLRGLRQTQVQSKLWLVQERINQQSHNSRYTSSESSRLTVMGSQVRPSGEVQRATIVGRNRGVAPGMSVSWGDRAPKLHADLTAGASPGGRQSG